jgi:hypothetical protein
MILLSCNLFKPNINNLINFIVCLKGFNKNKNKLNQFFSYIRNIIIRNQIYCIILDNLNETIR